MKFFPKILWEFSHLLFVLQGFKYLYLTPSDYKQLLALNSVRAEHIEEDGESRYKITYIIGEMH